MKITRHAAPDMRQALRLVREQLGPDAVILSSRRTAGGVEITAAMDFDAREARALETFPPQEPLIQQTSEPATERAAVAQQVQAAQQINAAKRPPASGQQSIAQSQSGRQQLAAVPTSAMQHPQTAQSLNGPRVAAAQGGPSTSVSDFAQVYAAASEQTPSPAANTDETAFPLALSEAEEAAYLPVKQESASPDEVVSNELRIMRRMLETQLAQLAWNDLTRRAPVQIEILRELTEIGLAPDLAAEVAAQAPRNTPLTQARRFVIAALSQRILVTGDRWLETGGKVALLGPTGVGKTTTLAKLAVRWVLRHGPRDLALVAGDAVRLGAQDQVQSLGQLLGARVYKLDDFAALPALLAKLSKTRFVLIDTPGSSQRDAQLASRLTALTAAGQDIETALVLAASTQAGAVEETIRRFASAKPTSCVLTKVDESASLGGALSALTRAKLPISYVSEGQRVPEDLRPARALELVSSSIQLAQTSGAAADEDMLRRRFGEVAHALA